MSWWAALSPDQQAVARQINTLEVMPDWLIASLHAAEIVTSTTNRPNGDVVILPSMWTREFISCQ